METGSAIDRGELEKKRRSSAGKRNDGKANEKGGTKEESEAGRSEQEALAGRQGKKLGEAARRDAAAGG